MSTERLREIKITNQILAFLVVGLSLALGISVGKQQGWIVNQPTPSVVMRQPADQIITLPKPNTTSGVTLAQALNSRRTQRQFTQTNLTQAQLSQLLWSAQGVTVSWGGRTVPTNKSAYPLEVSVVVRAVEGLEPGLYLYHPSAHTISRISGFTMPDTRTYFPDVASFHQAPASFIISGSKDAIAAKYDGVVREELIYTEAGGAVQNILLTAQSLGLGGGIINSFTQAETNVLAIPDNEIMVAIVPVGYPVNQ